MNKVVSRFLCTSLIPLCLTPVCGLAQETPRADKHYVGLLATAIEHRSIGEISNESAWSQAGALVIGGHLNSLIHAEIRLGGGFKDAEVANDLTLAVDYYASWYMGLHYPLGSFGNVYAQAGFTHLSGDATLANAEETHNRQFREIDGNYPGSSFSFSWVAGLDFELFSNTYLVLEGGKLFKDTETGANTFQFSSGLRYEF
ncbi:MAG TPA: outer membrane beta-barrel protein [Marinobacter sp.]|nr:outer membrane beta-barrel protein [Marinobacter sp.]